MVQAVGLPQRGLLDQDQVVRVVVLPGEGVVMDQGVLIVTQLDQ